MIYVERIRLLTSSATVLAPLLASPLSGIDRGIQKL